MVVVDGVTDLVPEEITAPIPLLIETEVAPAKFHCKVADCPMVIVLGLALKASIIGKPEVGVTTTIAVCVEKPYILLAVKV